MNKRKKFWVVLDQYGKVVSNREENEEDAERIAKTLALSQTGQEFAVLESIMSCRKSDVEWMIHEERDNMPF